jgi:hypothetical protein
VAGLDASAKGVFKSTDSGATWSVANLPDLIGTLLIDPRAPTTLYAAPYRQGVLKSEDSGATWSAIDTGITDILQAYGVSTSVASLVIDPATPIILYAGTELGVFKSSDGGASWRPTGLFRHSPLISLSLDPTYVVYGASSTGTVTLVTAAPEGGTTISLSSDAPTVATVPTSVTVPAGATTANFTITSDLVTRIVRISATLEEVTLSANLAVYATALNSLSVNPAIVSAGTPATGTVQLWAPAPAGGATIALSSSDVAVAVVPPSVTVPAGATTANFAVSTGLVTSPTTVTISADNYRTELTVTPPPPTTLASVTLKPDTLIAGESSIGTVTLSKPASADAIIALSSSDSSVAKVPANVVIAVGHSSATFTVSSLACAAGAVTISATYSGASRSAGLAVTTTPDAITVPVADYFAKRRLLRVEATSSNPFATLSVLESSSATFIGILTPYDTNRYRGQFTWPVNPQHITVRSDRCGLGTKEVTLK